MKLPEPFKEMLASTEASTDDPLIGAVEVVPVVDRGDPRDDILSALVRAEDEGERLRAAQA